MVRHVFERGTSADAGVVDENVYTSESSSGGLDNLLTILHGVETRDGNATHGCDVVDEGFEGLMHQVNCGSEWMLRASYLWRASMKPGLLIHNHVGTSRGEKYSIGSPETSTSAGDHDSLVVESKL